MTDAHGQKIGSKLSGREESIRLSASPAGLLDRSPEKAAEGPLQGRVRSC